MTRRFIVLGMLWSLAVLGGCRRQVAAPGRPPGQQAVPPLPTAGAGQPVTAKPPAPARPEPVLTLTADSFAKQVLQSSRPALVDFWAPWCPPCRQQAPVVDKIAQDYRGRVVVGKVNVDEQEELARRYQVEAIPTLVFFKGGKEVARLVGFTPREKLAAKLEELLNKSQAR
jgi:thioredoxin 1